MLFKKVKTKTVEYESNQKGWTTKFWKTAYENQQEILEAKQQSSCLLKLYKAQHYSCDCKFKGCVFLPKHDFSNVTYGPRHNKKFCRDGFYKPSM